MRLSNPWPLFLSLILAPLACSKPRFVYTVDPAFQAASYRTLALDPRKDLVFIREGFRPLDPRLHRQAVIAELLDRGYQSVEPGGAEVWVNVQVLVKAQPEGRRDSSAKAAHGEGSGEGQGRHGHGGKGGAARTGQDGGGRGGAEEVLVIVQFLDRKTGLAVWQGEVNPGSRGQAPGDRPPSIEEVVHQLLLPLPALQK